MKATQKVFKPLRRVDEYPEWLIDACMPKQNLFTLISTWRAGEKTEVYRIDTL